jgi:hypothetical protein
LQQSLRASHEFVLLHAAEGHRFDATASLENVLTQLTRPLPGGSGLTSLDLLARKLFSLGLEPLVRSGEVPSQDRESALLSLTQRPTETFDFHHPAAVTAHWARDHFDILGPRLIVELSQILQSPMRDVAFWVEVLFRYAATTPEHPSRLAVLLTSVGTSTPTSAHYRLTTLLHMISQWQRIVLVVDELEGLSANPDAALRLATFLTTLRHGAERVDVILSVNDDIWESAFVPRLSGGLLDRLSEAFVRLTPLSADEAVALLQSRHPSATLANLEQLQLNGDLYARAVLRAAALHGPLPVFIPSPVLSPELHTEPEIIATPAPVSYDSFITEPPSFTEETFSQSESFPEPPVESSPAIPSDFSPFSVTPLYTETSDFQPFVAPETSAAPSPEPEATDSDRVNELLRQFRERYGNIPPQASE